MQPENAPEPQPEFLRTDPRQRRNLALLLVGTLGLALLFYFFGLPALHAWLTVGYTDTVLRKFALVCYALAALMLLAAACTGMYARRVFRSGQFPPPGTWVLKDTPVRRGAAARAPAWIAVAVAVSCVLLAVYVITMPQRLRERLLPPAAVKSSTLPSIR